MARFPMRLFGAALMTACSVGALDLEGKSCPCGLGFVCRDGRCTRGAGTAGAAGRGGANGGSAGAAGAQANGGAADGGSPTCPPAPEHQRRRLTAGRSHSCAIREGLLFCWGSNAAGQLGIGSTETQRLPVRVPGPDAQPLARVTSVAAGAEHTCATVDTNGFHALHCWGLNDFGQLGLGDLHNRLLPVLVSANVGFPVFAAGESHSCGVTWTGELWCWGRQQGGSTGLGVIGPPLTVPAPVDTSEHYAHVEAGNGQTCGVRKDGSLWCWGHYECYQTGGTEHWISPHQVGTRCWKQTSAGASHTCGIDADDELWCWGSNDAGQLGLGLLGGGVPTTMGCGESNVAYPEPQHVMPGTKWSSLGAGTLNTCAITRSGELWCWGYNEQRQVEDSATTYVSSPARVGADRDWVEVALGFFHVCALNTAGEVFCAGSDDEGQQGTSTASTTLTPLVF